jgi:DNA-binding MarR family transcriptional regulator
MRRYLYNADILDSHELDDLAEELSQLWRELGRTLTSRRMLASLQSGSTSPLTPTKLYALDVLAEAGDLRIGELAERVGLDETSATRLVDRLEAAGIAERRNAPEDRRVTMVGLTAVGADLAAKIGARRQLFFCEVLGSLDPDDRASLVRLTATAAASLRAKSAELAAR